ncbi:MAG TPA: DoxX family protein [Streptosporangiaceae bacterium]|jgi:uncharacterized membrane protein
MIGSAGAATGVRARTGTLVYWAATALVTAELAVGGLWDVLRVDQVSGVVARLGYPSYVLVVLGVWKILGAAALLAPRFPRLKEWAYAGVVFADTTAIVSHAWVGFGAGEVAVLVALLALTIVSWATRPPGRRLA